MELDDFLSVLRGQGSRDSEGVFTLNLSRAMARMREMALCQPYDFVLRAIQSGVASGATKVMITLQKGCLTITHDGPLGETEDLLAWLTGAREGLSRAQIHLAMGLVVAPLRWDLRVGSSLISRREDDLTSHVVSHPSSVLLWEIPLVETKVEQLLPVLERACHSPITVQFQGKDLFAPWLSSQATTQTRLGDPCDLFLSINLCENGGFLVPSLPTEEMEVSNEGYIWRGSRGWIRRKTAFAERRPTWYLELNGTVPTGKTRWHCRRAIRRPLYDVGPAQVQFVIDGVTLPAERVESLSNLEVLEHADWAQTDLSGRKVVHDEAYQRFCEELAETLSNLQSAFSRCWHNVTRVANGKLGQPSPDVRQVAFQALGLAVGSMPCQEFHASFLSKDGRVPIARFGHRGPYLALRNGALEYLSVHPCHDPGVLTPAYAPTDSSLPTIPLLDILRDREQQTTEYALVLPFHNLPSFGELRWKLPLARQLRIAANLAAALERLHRKYGYGYLTPWRILVGANDTVHLQNLELSRVEQAMRTQIAMNNTSPSYEDLAYLSPEEITSAKTADPVGKDLYRAGALIREILLGAPTDLGPQPPMSYLLRPIQESPPDLSSECPRYSRELTAMVTRMLQKSPKERSVSLGRLAELLACEAEKLAFQISSENL